MRLIKLLIILGVLYLSYNAFIKEHFFIEQEDVISKMCKESHDFYKANEDMCKTKIVYMPYIYTYVLYIFSFLPSLTTYIYKYI